MAGTRDVTSGLFTVSRGRQARTTMEGVASEVSLKIRVSVLHTSLMTGASVELGRDSHGVVDMCAGVMMTCGAG